MAACQPRITYHIYIHIIFKSIFTTVAYTYGMTNAAYYTYMYHIIKKSVYVDVVQQGTLAIY